MLRQAAVILERETADLRGETVPLPHEIAKSS